MMLKGTKGFSTWRLVTIAFVIGILCELILVYSVSQDYVSNSYSSTKVVITSVTLGPEASAIVQCEKSRNEAMLLENMHMVVKTMNGKYRQSFNNSVSARMFGTRRKVNMRKELFPFVNFKFVVPQIVPKANMTRKYFLIVLVNSGARGIKYRKRRETIRRTWGNQSNCEQRKASADDRLKDLKWLVVFLIGKVGAKTNDDKLNMAEARKHNDMLIGNIQDNYVNNVVKLYMGQTWASLLCPNYTMKTDDDVYVRVPRVLEYLANAGFPRPFYGGRTKTKKELVIRRLVDPKKRKWALSFKYYEEKRYPKYNPGAFIILSGDLLARLFSYVSVRRPFHTDDAYVGLAMLHHGVNATTIASFHLNNGSGLLTSRWRDARLLRTDAFGHDVDPESSVLLHVRLQKLCGKTQSKSKFRKPIPQVTPARPTSPHSTPTLDPISGYVHTNRTT